jgi:hypothetical protein
MYEAYFTRRLLQALTLAEEAPSAEERAIHLRASRYYRELLDLPESRRSVRHPVRIAAVLHRAAPEPRAVIVSDLSTSGFRVELDQPVSPGTLVALQIDGLAPIDARVVWQEDDQVGFKFVKPLNPVLLDAALAVSPRVA